ncbi:MAG: zinc ABC transporter substrate-binding protein [Synergistaceae bacterium]|nr:zinc ABC transporter substrate-binding protein [Synergistaceae bacterium]
MKLKTLTLLALLSFTASCAHANISVTCSLFPVCDFTRSITGNLADVKLLLPPGTEPHEYEPSPRDIMSLNDSDVFIFTGTEMESWAVKLSQSLSNTRIIDASDGIILTDNDPHIWLDLSLAQKMVMNILRGLCEADPGNSEEYKRNAGRLCAGLSEIDGKFSAMRKTRALIFADEFSAGYFVRRYGFDYVSAYEGENEPSVRKMAEVIRYIRQHKARYIFADIGPVSSVAREISSQTGAEILTFGTGHIVPEGMTFLQMMTDNFEHISEAMND